MKRIISHFNSHGNTANIQDISNEQGLSTAQIKALCTNKLEIFTFEGDSITYAPPFGICDKHSLKTSISNAFPKGIKHSLLKMCYEFALSDFNELTYEDKVFLSGYGKTEDVVIFKPNTHDNDLSELWALHFKPYADITSSDMPFPKNMLS